MTETDRNAKSKQAAAPAREDVACEALRPINLGIAGICVIVAIGDLLVLSGPARLPLAAIAGGTAVLLALMGWMVDPRDLPSRSRAPLFAAATLLLLLNLTATNLFKPGSVHPLYFAILAVTALMLPLPTRWRNGLFATTAIAWGAIAAANPQDHWAIEALTFVGALVAGTLAVILQGRIRASLGDLEQESEERQAALTDSQIRFELAMAGSNDGLYDWDLDTGSVYFSQRLRDLLGTEVPVQGRILNLTDRIHPDDSERVRERLVSHLKGESECFEDEFRIRDADDGYSWVLARGATTRDARGKALRMAGSITDMTRRGVFDALTGLPNRRLFMDRLRRVTERGRTDTEDEGFAVIFLDLDDFKLINDSLGHKTGDDLLREVGKRLLTCVRAIDTVARLGGDEFVILLEKVKVPIAEGVQITVDRILGKLLDPYVLDEREIHVRTSMGVVNDTAGYDSPEDILRDADTAMYQAKEKGRPFVVFDVTMRERLTQRLQLESELRRALHLRQFVVHFQSIVALDSGEVEGYEALVRWEHPKRGLLAPAEFIEVMEETGLVVPLGKLVLRQACRHMARRFPDRTADRLPYLSVNLSGKHLAQEDLVRDLETVLEETGFDAERLRIEITETAIVDNPRRAAQALTRLKTLGVQIQMDDFGTGHSSLSYLQTLPIDTLKIDRSFISRMTTEEDGRELVRTIVRMAHSLGLTVVAEGIETDEQVGILKEMACASGQGFLFARPDELASVRTDDDARSTVRVREEPALTGRDEPTR